MFRGRRLGVYNSWRICQDQVSGYRHNCYRGYATFEKAQQEYNQYLAQQAMADRALPVQGVALVAMALAEEPQQARRTWLKGVISVDLIVVILKLVFL